MSSSQIERYYAKEESLGVLPGSPAWKRVPVTTEDLAMAPETAASNQITGSGRPQFGRRVGEDSSGTWNDELIGGMYDDWLEFALASAGWSTQIDVAAANIAFAAPVGSSQGLTYTASSGLFDDWEVGSFGYIAPNGSVGDEENHGWFRLLTKDDGAGTASIENPSGVLSASASHTLHIPSTLVDGTTVSSMHIARKYGHLVNTWSLNKKVIVGGFGMNVSKRQLITVSFPLTGIDAETKETSAPYAGTPALASSLTEKFAEPDVTAIAAGGHRFCVTDIQVQYANGIAQSACVGQSDTFDKRTGSFTISFNFNYKGDGVSFYDQFLADTTVPFYLAFVRNGIGYLIEMVAGKISGCRRSGAGNDTEVISPATITAGDDQVSDALIKVYRFTAP